MANEQSPPTVVDTDLVAVSDPSPKADANVDAATKAASASSSAFAKEPAAATTINVNADQNPSDEALGDEKNRIPQDSKDGDGDGDGDGSVQYVKGHPVIKTGE